MATVLPCFSQAQGRETSGGFFRDFEHHAKAGGVFTSVRGEMPTKGREHFLIHVAAALQPLQPARGAFLLGGVPPVLHPFIDVAAEVVDAEFVGLETHHRGGGGKAVVVVHEMGFCLELLAAGDVVVVSGLVLGLGGKLPPQGYSSFTPKRRDSGVDSLRRLS